MQKVKAYQKVLENKFQQFQRQCFVVEVSPPDTQRHRQWGMDNALKPAMLSRDFKFVEHRSNQRRACMTSSKRFQVSEKFDLGRQPFMSANLE